MAEKYIETAKHHIQQTVDRTVKAARENQPAAIAIGASVGLLSVYGIYKAATRPTLQTKTIAQYEKPSESFYDVAIVGAGPSGSTLGYYMAGEGKNVLLLEKKKFPRDKYCGDAVTSIAQKHLLKMGVLQEIVAEKKGFYAQNGGFVSPCGNSFIGNSAHELNLGTGGTAIAIKRIVLDEKIARAAKNAGANLTEDTTVTNATFDDKTGIWKVDCTTTEGQNITYYARVLVCADGAPSKLARQLGYVNCEPQGVCSRAYITGNKLFKWDGVVYYPPKLLPGYCAIIREAGDELNFACYIIPGGQAKNEDLSDLHHDILANYPYVSKVVGPNPNIERMKAASLRLGGIDKSYDQHLLIIGDAAGFIDPLTGEGIQYAMDSGKIASDVIIEGLKKGDLSEKQLKKYQDLWVREWGREFYWSMKMSLLLGRFPIMLDAAAKLIGKRGSRFLAEWAEVMTGSASKMWFLRWDVGPYLLLEIFAQAFNNLVGKKPVNFEKSQ